jgi:DNA-binding protein HU-beta
MNKTDLVQFIRDRGTVGFSKRAAEDAMYEVLLGIRQGLLDDGEVRLMGFGTFTVKHRKARTARNPQTGEAVKVPAKNVVHFKPSKDFNAVFNKKKKAKKGKKKAKKK